MEECMWVKGVSFGSVKLIPCPWKNVKLKSMYENYLRCHTDFSLYVVLSMDIIGFWLTLNIWPVDLIGSLLTVKCHSSLYLNWLGSVIFGDVLRKCMQLLGLLDYLKGVTSEFVSSACLVEYIADGEVPKINATDPEQLSQFSAHLVSTAIPDQQCNYISFDPSGDLNPLQRAEWIKYVAAFLNYESRANHVFEMVKENYLCLSASAVKASTKPRIAWLAYNEEIWTFSNETYKLQYVSDAGGTNLEESIYMTTFNMSLPSEVESFHKILSTLDVVIDESYASAPAEYTISTFTVNAGISEYESFPFMVSESVWRYDKQVESAYVTDWHDGAVAQPQLVLGDLIQALHPQPNYKTTYLRNIGKGEGINISSEKCAHNRSTPMEPITVLCNNLVII